MIYVKAHRYAQIPTLAALGFCAFGLATSIAAPALAQTYTITDLGTLIWPSGVNRDEPSSRYLARAVSVPVGDRTGWGTRGAELQATMDQADIRGLVTALHRSVAGLPRSRNGDHQGGCPHSVFEGSPHRVHASRSRSGVSAVTSLPRSSSARWLFRYPVLRAGRYPRRRRRVRGRARRRSCCGAAREP